jgi:hypothetical protein
MKKLLTLIFILIFTNNILAKKEVLTQDEKFVFDLSKVNFKENINSLFPSQEKLKVILVNDNFENKNSNEILKEDIPKAFQYSVNRDKKKQRFLFMTVFLVLTILSF